MVGHTHQDFLIYEDSVVHTDITPRAVDLSLIKDYSFKYELFDLPDCYVRKASLSFMDEFIDNENDWRNFVKPLTGINCLYLVDDRQITNGIMEIYARQLNQKYIAQLEKDGIPAVIAIQNKKQLLRIPSRSANDFFASMVGTEDYKE